MPVEPVSGEDVGPVALALVIPANALGPGALDDLGDLDVVLLVAGLHARVPRYVGPVNRDDAADGALHPYVDGGLRDVDAALCATLAQAVIADVEGEELAMQIIEGP